MKNIMLLTIVCAWWHSSPGQTEGGVQQYYSMNDRALSISPIVWYQGEKGFYMEGRYNYEAEKALSIYAGKTFAKTATVSYSISPLAGILVGAFKGFSIAANSEVEYRNLFFSLQSQYSFSTRSREGNFFYHWGDLGMHATQWLSAGVSMQQTNVFQTKGQSDKGIFARAASGRWEFPVYLFVPNGEKSYTVMGMNYTLQNKKQRSRGSHNF